VNVDLIECCGNDLLVVNAARVSMDKWHDEFDDVSDTRLLNYLAREGHNSPFFHPHITLRVTAPIFIARQLMRSTVGLSISEVSRRYVSSDPMYWRPESWRGTADNVKQGSGDELSELASATVEMMYLAVIKHCEQAYKSALKLGLCPEQARAMLPLSTETTWIWTGSLYAFWRVYLLRSDSHAQCECQQIAAMIWDHCAAKFPHSWKALEANR